MRCIALRTGWQARKRAAAHIWSLVRRRPQCNFKTARIKLPQPTASTTYIKPVAEIAAAHQKQEEEKETD